jgi:uncharacterized protein
MKKITVLLVVNLFFLSPLFSQHSDYKVVFDITSKDSVNQQAVVREVNLIKTANPDAQIEVVVYGQGLNLVLKDKSLQAEAIEKLLTYKDVDFKICAVTMQRNNIDSAQLLPGVKIVPDGIYEIISRQKENWGYIKVAH